jgi:hypothetical protein
MSSCIPIKYSSRPSASRKGATCRALKKGWPVLV